MCVICRNEIDYKKTKLDCSNCQELIEIPDIQGLLMLTCIDCPKLKIIPNIEGLQRICCNNCPELIKIPDIRGLQALYFVGCPLLTSIPHINGLRILSCTNCPKIKVIPNIKGLQVLYCYNCEGLTEISNIEGLYELHCVDCRKLIKSPIVYIINTTGSVWLNESNPKYEENIAKLKMLQKWMKRIIMSKKLNRLIPQLMPLYYHPDLKGGYLHKREMQGFVNSLI